MAITESLIAIGNSQSAIALATMLSRLYESYRGFVSWCYQCRDNAYQEAISEFLLSMGKVMG